MYLIVVAMVGLLAFHQLKNKAQFEHCIVQAAELDVKLSSINQSQNAHYIATEYVAALAACNGDMPKLSSRPIPAVLSDAQEPGTIAEGQKKAAERKAGVPLL